MAGAEGNATSQRQPSYLPSSINQLPMPATMSHAISMRLQHTTRGKSVLRLATHHTHSNNAAPHADILAWFRIHLTVPSSDLSYTALLSHFLCPQSALPHTAVSVVLVWTRTRNFGHLPRGSIPGPPGLGTGFNGTERARWRLSVRNSANAVRPCLSGPSCAPKRA